MNEQKAIEFLSKPEIPKIQEILLAIEEVEKTFTSPSLAKEIVARGGLPESAIIRQETQG